MAGMKFYVHGGGTWRELNTNSGRVTGWGKIQFLYVRRGRLVVARRNSVLKGLRALVSGKPTTVRDGPRLPHIRRRKQINKQQYEQNQFRQYNHCCPCQHNCNNHQQQSISDKLFNSLLQPTKNSTATQCALNEPIKVDNVTQVIHHSDTDKTSEVEQVKFIDTDISTEEEQIKPTKKDKKHKVESKKELIIDEEDILLVRNFIENNEKNVFKVSLIDFDADDNCKRRMFYKINPLVEVSRSKEIAEMLRPHSQCSSVTLKDFITTLGLQRVEEVRTRSKYKMRARKTNENDANKENLINIKSKKRRQLLIRNTSKTNSQLHSQVEKKSNKRSLNNEANIERSEEKRKNSSDEESFKLSLYSEVNSKRTQPTVLFTKRVQNVKKDASRLGNNKLLKKSHKLCLIKDAAGIQTKKNVEDKSFQNTIAMNERENPLPREKRIKEALNIRKNKINNKILYNEQEVKKILSTKIQQTVVNKNTNKDIDKNILNKKSSHSRPYSRAEDEAIITWIKEEQRAHLVNGNRLWKELQPLHHKNTGHFRPWQSLRNRYLRYVLPSLADLAVPPQLAQKLRAAAAEGEIKLKTSPQSNSIFKDTRVRSAWALRPRSPLRSPTGPVNPAASPSKPNLSTGSSSRPLRSRAVPSALPAKTARPTPKRVEESEERPTRDDSTSSTSSSSDSSSDVPKRTLRSSLIPSPLLPTPSKRDKREPSLTYSEVTRRFASRHKSTPESDISLRPRQEKRLRSAITQSDVSFDQYERDAKRQRSEDSEGESPKEFVSRYSRRLLRSTQPARTRRLYNPRAI